MRAMESTPARPTLDVVRWLCAYQGWSGAHILDVAAKLDESQARQPGMIAGGHRDGSLFETLAHLNSAAEIWLSRWEGNQRATFRDSSDFADMVSLYRNWHAVERRLAGLLRLLTQAHLDGLLHYFTTAGVPQALPLGQTIIHATIHSTHHRAEAAVALTALGSPPPRMDLLEFMRANAPGA